MPPASQTPPSSDPAVQSLPKSPDRPGSASPFAPSAADLPSMPEPALTSRANLTGRNQLDLRELPEIELKVLGEGIASDNEIHPQSCLQGLASCVCAKQDRVSWEVDAWEGGRGEQRENPCQISAASYMQENRLNAA